MKKDLDYLMQKMGIDAIYAEGHASHDSTMYYLLNEANIYGHYLKKRRERACCIHSSIEREEAQKSGLKLINMTKYELGKIYNKYEDGIKAHALGTKKILDDLKVKGRVVFYGNYGLGSGYNFLNQLQKYDHKIRIAYESERSLISRLRETKDRAEVARIQKIGRQVIRSFNALLTTVRKMKVKDDYIVKARGERLRIKDLKKILSEELFKNNLINSAGLIVAQGRDAGVPHNSGCDREFVRIGKTIVFDIFPQEIGGGYFFDFTRTVCFGYAPENIIEHFEIVKQAKKFAIEKLRVGKRTTAIEKAICQFFEKKGHKTLLNDPKNQIGYCHSIGHGVGLNIHEGPSFGLSKTNHNRIEPGMVFTIEPGLYYPDQGFGIRLEDIVYIDPFGKVVNLTNYPSKLIVEL